MEDPGIRRIAPNHGVEGAVIAHLLVDYHVDQHVSLGPDARGLQEFDRKDMTRDAALHVTGAAAVDPAFLDLRRPGMSLLPLPPEF